MTPTTYNPLYSEFNLNPFERVVYNGENRRLAGKIGEIVPSLYLGGSKFVVKFDHHEGDDLVSDTRVLSGYNLRKISDVNSAGEFVPRKRYASDDAPARLASKKQNLLETSTEIIRRPVRKNPKS